VRKPEGKRPLGRPRRRLVDIKMGLRVIGWGDVDWIGLAQDRDKCRAFVNAVMNLRGSINMLGSYRVASHLLASRVVLTQLHIVNYELAT
jgi:hypothetical protein